MSAQKFTKKEIETWIIQWIAKETQVNPESISVEESFVNFGLTSAQGIFFSADLSDWINLNLEPSLIWDYPNIELLSSYIDTQLSKA